MNKETIHIVFIPEDPDRMCFVMNKICILPHYVIPATHANHVRNILHQLSEDTPVLIWIHMNQQYDEKKGYTNNMELSAHLKGDLGKDKQIVHRDTRIYFFTTAGVEKIEGEFIDEYNLAKRIGNEQIYDFKIFYESNRDKMPPPQLVRDLLRGEWNPIENFDFLRGGLNFMALEFQKTFTNNQIADILGAMLPAGFERYQLDVLKSTAPNTFIVKVICNNPQLEVYAIKISKDHEALEREAWFGEQGRKRSLHGKKFLMAEPLEGNQSGKDCYFRKLHGWYCLRTNFLFDKITLLEYLGDPREGKLGYELFKDIFEHLSDLEELGTSPNEKNIEYVKNLPPFVGGILRPGLNYKGLKLQDSSKKSCIQTLEWIGLHYPKNLLDSIGLFRELKLLYELLEDSQFILRDIEMQSRGNSTPVKFVHGDLTASNVLISQNGQDIAFINFSNITRQPTQHALMDVGCLSADLELALLPDKMIVYNFELLRKWLDFHKSWLYHEMERKIDVECLELIYQLNDHMLDYSINRHHDQIWRDEIIRQFHLVRLHFFLKALGARQAVPEKLMFLAKASVDIINFLRQGSLKEDADTGNF